jgi:SAM-dependent methyltransferase
MASVLTSVKDMAKRSELLTEAALALRGIRSLDGVGALDAWLADHARRHSILDDKALQELNGICLRIRDPKLPEDPFSPAYRERVMEIYLQVSGKKDYSLDYEAAQFDPEKEKFNFFPYNSKSLRLVGSQLVTQGLTLQNISLPPGGSIVELGAGQGNTALHLSLTGYQVTVVEVNQPSIDLIAYRAKVHGREIRFARQDMSEFVRTTADRFDAALFVASFHHCLDHMAMLENIDRIVKPGGAIYFADEPIYYAKNRFLPYPWGLRLDGNSLFFIRRDGWLELGFQYGYFAEALDRAGWTVQTRKSRTPGYPHFFEARRK